MNLEDLESGRSTRMIGDGSLRLRSRGGVGTVSAFVWLVFLVFPLADAVGHRAPALERALAVAGAVAFVGSYIALVLMWRRGTGGRRVIALYIVLLATATALTVADRPGWGFLFTYAAAATSLLVPARLTLLAIGACVALAGGMSALGGADGGSVVGFVASTAGIGLLMVLLRDLRIRNDELTEARAELARLAVAQERERFARDLHDLLGHSLSVIALKAELAGRLLPVRPDDAAREIAEAETVARSALGEVREAASGYRQPTLDGELAGARMALSAAGIDADVQRADVALAPEVEAVLAWSVREGATNVIRHSSARHCTVRVSADLRDAIVEVIDDGPGGGGPRLGVASANGSGRADGGHGIAGLRERAELFHGSVDAGVGSDGGFTLAVRVPIGSSVGSR
jgi:two-component system sensor histidine kinase DesK